MQRYHLNCGTIYPPWGVCLFGVGTPFRRAAIVTHCILVETTEGLLLVDTGIGRSDLDAPDLVTHALLSLGGSKRDQRETAVAQIQSLGLSPTDVRHIALTHFHYDHAGGLPDFPHAKIHIYKEELNAIMSPRDVNERLIYRARHRSHQPDWVVHQCEGDHWFGFDRTPLISLGSIQFCFIPLHGHTRGHAGVALQTDSGWLLHCGDAYTFHGEVDPVHPRSAPHEKTLRPIVNLNYAFRNIGWHTGSLRELLISNGDEVTLTNSHDPVEFTKFFPKFRT